jgi:hypothetical protein
MFAEATLPSLFDDSHRNYKRTLTVSLIAALALFLPSSPVSHSELLLCLPMGSGQTLYLEILSTCVKCPGLTRRVEHQMYMSCTAIYHCSEASLITNEFHAILAMWLHPRPEILLMTSNDDGYRAKNDRGKALTF